MNTTRWIATIALLLLQLVFAGSIIWSGGHGGWIVWVLFISIAPIALSFLTPRLEPLIGGAANLATELSIAWTRYNWMSEHSDQPTEWFMRSFQFIIATGLFSVLFGSILGLAVRSFRFQKTQRPDTIVR